MAENFCQNAKKKNNRQTVPFSYLSFRPISLAALTDLFQYHSDWNFFFLCYTRKGEWNNQTSRARFNSGNVRYEAAFTNEGSRCHVRTAQSVQQEGKV